jgi:hypothetical protein
LAKAKILNLIKRRFLEERTTILSFNTTHFLADIRQFHINWQFQLMSISDWNTLEGFRTPTDLTGALGNFNIYVAVSNVEISCKKYFKYEKSSNFYCLDIT